MIIMLIKVNMNSYKASEMVMGNSLLLPHLTLLSLNLPLSSIVIHYKPRIAAAILDL